MWCQPLIEVTMHRKGKDKTETHETPKSTPTESV